jgi:hypothetical protein
MMRDDSWRTNRVVARRTPEPDPLIAGAISSGLETPKVESSTPRRCPAACIASRCRVRAVFQHRHPACSVYRVDQDVLPLLVDFGRKQIRQTGLPIAS